MQEEAEDVEQEHDRHDEQVGEQSLKKWKVFSQINPKYSSVETNRLNQQFVKFRFKILPSFDCKHYLKRNTTCRTTKLLCVKDLNHQL